MKVLLEQSELKNGVERMARQISDAYQGEPITIIAIMTGSLVLLADLIRRLEMPLRVGLIQASSYRGGTTSGELVIDDKMMLDITDRQVVVIDDIFDTGKTLVEVMAGMRALNPASLRSGVLLSKVGCQKVDYQPDYVAFEIPDEFVVGYGLDYEDQYRNLPFLASLEPADLEAHRPI